MYLSRMALVGLEIASLNLALIVSARYIKTRIQISTDIGVSWRDIAERFKLAEQVTARHGSQLTMSIWIPNQAQSREVPQNQAARKAAATLFQTAKPTG